VSSFGLKKTQEPDKTSLEETWPPSGTGSGLALSSSSLHMKHLITHPNRDTCVENIAQLQRALTTAKNNSEYAYYKTKLEQAAGRAAILEARRDHLAMKGKEELQRRFSNRAVLAASWEKRGENADDIWADVMVQPADGSAPLVFTEKLEEFPSDECIANIALVV
jgi:hypothetical protein